MIQIGVRSTGSRSRVRRKRSFLSSVIAPFNYIVRWAAHQRSTTFTEIPGLLPRRPGYEIKSNAEVVEYPFRRIAALDFRGFFLFGVVLFVVGCVVFCFGCLVF